MIQWPVLVFDIETVEDIQAGKRIHQLDLPDDEAAQALSNLRKQDTGHDFPRLPFHQIVCISGLWIEDGSMKLFSFSQADLTEAEILQKFLGIFDKRTPTLVSWNGSGFDIPVILYRAMLHKLSATGLLDQGEHDSQKRHNNYQSRYHQRHTDLMDVMAMFNNRNFQKLDHMAQLLGFAGKQGSSGADVAGMVRAGHWSELTEYCESDVLNTWLIYLRWQLLRGVLDLAGHDGWLWRTQAFLAEGRHKMLSGDS